MKQSDPLALVDAGTLARPGPVGRLVRMALGAFCFYVLWELWLNAGTTTASPVSTFGNRLLLILAPLYIINYVVNIGFSKSWGRRPLFASLAVLVVSACGALLVSGTFDSPIVGLPLNLWLAYFYSHLGISFGVSALLATPGCEMRAIPELYGRMRGKPSGEHHCPVAFITRIDEWERQRLQHP
jgi:hypothetical protein